MAALIGNGFEWLRPLLRLRDEIVADRNKIEYRLPTRRNGTQAVNDMGPYKSEYRAALLEKLLSTQKELQDKGHKVDLITNQELIAVQTIWYRDFIFDNKVSQIYQKIYKKGLKMNEHNERTEKELDLLKKSCSENPNDFDLIQELITLQKNKSLLNRKRGLEDDIETRIEEYLKREKKNAN